MKIIETYIKFAIDNGYKLNKRNYFLDISNGINISYYNVINIDNYDIYDILSQKEFIEAITSGLKKLNYDMSCIGGDSLCTLYEQITIQQAIAIRDGKLEEFINNLELGKQ